MKILDQQTLMIFLQIILNLFHTTASALSYSTSFTSTSSTNNLEVSTLLNNGYGVTNINSSLNSLGSCQVYTFENNYDIPIKPSLNILGNALNSNFAHLEDNAVCVSGDQLQASYYKHTCVNDNCLSTDGNKLPKGSIEIYPSNCSTTLPVCPGGFYNISMNFTQGERGIIGTSTRCLNVNSITIPTSLYDTLSQFYKESGIFIPSNEVKDDQYETVITSEICQPGNFKQKFRVVRYTWDGSDFNLDDDGFFAEIIFRPLNLKLTTRKSDLAIVFERKDGVFADPNWLLIPPLDLSPQQLTTVQRGNMCQPLTIYNRSANKFAGYNVEFDTNDGIRISVSTEGNIQKPRPNSNTGLFSNIIPAKNGFEVIDTSYTWSD